MRNPRRNKLAVTIPVWKRYRPCRLTTKVGFFRFGFRAMQAA